MFHLRLESNVRHENEENFFYSKKKRVVYKTKYLTMRQNLSSDNERLGLMFDEQDNGNMTRRLFIVKERTMSSKREIDVRSVNLFQIDVFIDRTIEFDLLFLCQLCFRSPIPKQTKI